MGNVRLGSDDRGVATRRPVRLRSAAFVVAAVAGLAILGHCVPVRIPSLPSYAEQSQSSTSLPAAFGAGADQSYLAQVLPVCKASKIFALEAIPQSAVTTLLALGIGVVALAVRGRLAQLVVPAGRSPPAGPVAILAGQHLLTRFCLSRR